MIANLPILKNVVSPRWSKTLMEMGLHNPCRQYWLWDTIKNECTLANYYYDMERVYEQADINILLLMPNIKKFAAFTTNELEPLVGNYKMQFSNGTYRIITEHVSVNDTRMADAFAHIVLMMLEKGLICHKSLQVLNGR